MYRLVPEGETVVRFSRQRTLREAREIAADALGGNPVSILRVNAYVPHGECVEIWEGGRLVWRRPSSFAQRGV